MEQITPFYNHIAEMCFVNSILFENDSTYLLDEVDASDFHERNCEIIVKDCKEMWSQGQKPDLIAVANRLGFDYVKIITDFNKNGDLYAYKYRTEKAVEDIKACRQRRDALLALKSASSSLNDSEQTVEAVIQTLVQSVNASDSSGMEGSTMGEILGEVLDEMRNGITHFTATSIPTLDKITGGLFPGEMTVIGARPGTGKSALAMQIALQAARDGKRAIFVSREMSNLQIGQRMISTLGIPTARIRHREFREDELPPIEEMAKSEAMKNLLIDNRSHTASRIRANARRWQQKGGLDLIVVDYLQLLSPEADSKAGSRNNEVGEMSWACKMMAMDLKIPVLLLSQLNRSPKDRPDAVPVLTDLRDSGSIEQDADNVWLLYLPKKTNNEEVNELIKFCEARDNSDASVVGIKVAKARQAEIGTVYTYFDKTRMSFAPAEAIEYEKESDNHE